MEEQLALASICKIMGRYAVEKEKLLEWIFKDTSREARDFLQPRCRSMPDLESFLARHPDYMMVENDMVCVSSPQLVRGSEGAVTYYSDILSTYYQDEEPCYYMNLRGHIGQANQDVCDFIETFYHGEEFMDFLLAHPDDFVVFDDDKVHHVDEMEEKSVQFFRNCLEKFGEGIHFADFRGDYTHSTYVRQYMKQYYPKDDFLIFLKNNDDVFYLEDGYVYIR